MRVVCFSVMTRNFSPFKQPMQKYFSPPYCFHSVSESWIKQGAYTIVSTSDTRSRPQSAQLTRMAMVRCHMLHRIARVFKHLQRFRRERLGPGQLDQHLRQRAYRVMKCPTVNFFRVYLYCLHGLIFSNVIKRVLIS